MKQVIFSNLILILLLSLSSCAQFMKVTLQPSIEYIALGTDLVEEKCHMESGTILYETFFQAKRILNITCGNWEWPSARIFEVAANGNALDRWYKEGTEWRNTLNRRMHCDGKFERVKLFNKFDEILLTCKLNNGDWPYLALVVKIKDIIYLADGIPAALPSIERSIAYIAGIHEETKILPESPAIQYYKAQLKDRIYISTTDLQQYYQAMTLGQYYNSIKEFSKAKIQYKNALEIHQKKLGQDNAKIGDTLIHLALELSNLEQASDAEEHFSRAKHKINSNDNSADSIRSVSYYALHLANQGQFKRALTQVRQAKKQRKVYSKKNTISSGSDPTNVPTIVIKDLDSRIFTLEQEYLNPVEIAHSLYVESAMLHQLGDLSQSDRALSKAQGVLSMAQSSPPLWVPQMYSLSGVVKESKNEIIDAKESRYKALEKFEQLEPGKRPSLLAYLDLGKSLLNEKQLQDALNNFRQAVTFASSGNNSFRLYQLAPYFDALLDNNKITKKTTRKANYREAFNAAQLVKSGELTRDIARTVTRLGEKDNKVGQLISDLQKKQLQRINKQAELQRIFDQAHQGELKKLRAEIDQIDQEIQDLENAMQQVNPEYLQLLGLPVKIDDVIENLNDDEAMLQILVGKSKCYVFFVHKGQVLAYSVQITKKKIAQRVSWIRELLIESKKGDVSVVPPGVIKTAHRLFNNLLKPITEQLKTVEHLVVVSSGPLLSFPPGLFVTELPLTDKTQDDNFSNIQWLARKTSISLVPSAQSFIYLREHIKPSDAPNPLIAFGDFVAGSEAIIGQQPSGNSICQTDSKEILRSLPGTRKEIAAVAKLFPKFSNNDLFLNEEFTETAVKEKKRLKNYNIVYFATHALPPNENECRFEPSLVTSLNTSESANGDGLLTSSEIVDLELDADLVVLSACDTGGAEKSGGEGLSGLARAFFFAGARSLLVSHWNVDDEATAVLMTKVFTNLKSDKGTHFAKALRKAQIEMMDKPREKKWSNPFYWAAFTLVGDGDKSVSWFKRKIKKKRDP